MTERLKRTRSPAIETTGHEWDGIKELNNPLPRWWLYTFYATIVWSVVYWIAVSGDPVSGYTKGVLGYSRARRRRLDQEIGGRRAERAGRWTRIAAADPWRDRGRPNCWRSPWPAARRPSPTTARRATALGGAGRRPGGYPGAGRRRLAVGRHAGGHPVQTMLYGIVHDHDDTRVQRDAGLRRR